MKMNAWNLSLALLAAFALTACGGDKKSDPTPDTVTPDTVTPDTVTPDTTEPDTVTPDTTDPDVPCTSTCGLKECGDDGCGGVCGSCGDSQICADGTCVDDTASPCGECPEGTVCGANPDAPTLCVGDDCGDVTFEGSCEGTTAIFCQNEKLIAKNCDIDGPNYSCEMDPDLGADCTCTPQCDGKEPCADDGCGGICQTCGDGLICNDEKTCVDPCGTCPDGTTCGFNPDSPGACGSDTCGTVTFEGECQGDTVLFCDNEKLIAINCKENYQANPNGYCGYDDGASYYNCLCTPDCSADPCGSDGCGGTCNECPAGQTCNDEAQCADFAANKGNTCAVPIVIDALPFEDAGDSTTQQDVYSTGVGCTTGDDTVGKGQPDVVYQFTPTESGVHTVGLKDNTAGCTIVTVATDCADLDTGCTAYSGDLYGGDTFEVTLTADTPYYFIADGLYGSDVGGYVFTLEAGTACTPVCDGKDCGDNGCGSVCGSCADSQICNADGMCVDDVVPPIPGTGVDLSGYVLNQTNSVQSFTIPDGTIVPVGGTLVIGRKVEKDDFIAFWGITDTSGMTYINSDEECPKMNGGETYSITDGGGVVWDGPTWTLSEVDKKEPYHNYQRTAANAAAGEEASWVVTSILQETTDPNSGTKVKNTLKGVATPGISTTAGPSNSPIVITEIGDAAGTGAFAYEFIELTVFAIQ